MVTGQYGYRFHKHISRERMYDMATAAANELSKDLKSEKGINVGPVLFKDYYQRQLYPNDKLENFVRFKVQPMMTLEIKPEWGSFDDYLGAMRTKYRTRAKRCFKKSSDIRIEEMTASQIEEHKGIMYEMYLAIAQEASFNLFFLDVDYFYRLKTTIEGSLNRSRVL